MSKEPDDDDTTVCGKSAKKMLAELGDDPAMDALEVVIVFLFVIFTVAFVYK